MRTNLKSIAPSKIIAALAHINQQLVDEPLRAPNPLTEMAQDNQTFYKDTKPNRNYIDRVANHARD